MGPFYRCVKRGLMKKGSRELPGWGRIWAGAETHLTSSLLSPADHGGSDLVRARAEGGPQAWPSAGGRPAVPVRSQWAGRGWLARGRRHLAAGGVDGAAPGVGALGAARVRGGGPAGRGRGGGRGGVGRERAEAAAAAGPDPAHEPAQVQQGRGHGRAHLPQRGVRAAQSP